jgi:hypothetical protein
MKNKTIVSLYVSTLLLGLNGCAVYHPQSVDVPLIKEKGDKRLDVGIFFVPNISPNENDSSYFSDIGYHATYTAGITDLLAIQAYLNLDLLFRVHAHAALGLYKNSNNKTVMELYGGLGYGTGLISNSKDDYFLTFAQFNIGQTGLAYPKIDYGLGVKGGYLMKNNMSKTSFNTDIHKKNGWMFDPAFMIRFGHHSVKYAMKINYMWTNTVVDKHYYYPLSLSFGVNFQLGKK